MSTIIGLLVFAGYWTGWLLCARRLYQAWRPLRVARCGHYAECRGSKHDLRCYRRQNKDLTPVKIDTDRQAVMAAAAVALAWWGVGLAWLIRWRDPELESEKKDRLRRLDADIADRERQLHLEEEAHDG